MTDKTKKSWLGLLLLAISLLVMGFIISRSIQAVRPLSDAYHVLRAADPKQDLRATVYYDDGLYAVLGFGIESIGEDPAAAEQIDTFLTSSIRMIDERILGAAIIYTMLVTALMALFLFECQGHDAVRHTITIVCTALIVCALLMAVPICASAASGVPVYFPKGAALFVIPTSVLTMIGGNCALGLLLRKIRLKKIAAIAAIPVIYILFLFSTGLEIGLFSPSELPSFDYVMETVPDSEDAYYDESKDVLIVGDKEFPPEMLPNSEHLSGISRAGAIAYEAVDPYGGVGLAPLMHEAVLSIPFWASLLYILKALAWILVPVALKRRPARKTKV